VSFKSVIFGKYEMMKKPLRIQAKSLSDALAPSKKKSLRRRPSAALQGFRIYSWSAHCLPDFARKANTEGGGSHEQLLKERQTLPKTIRLPML